MFVCFSLPPCSFPPPFSFSRGPIGDVRPGPATPAPPVEAHAPAYDDVDDGPVRSGRNARARRAFLDGAPYEHILEYTISYRIIRYYTGLCDIILDYAISYWIIRDYNGFLRPRVTAVPMAAPMMPNQ